LIASTLMALALVAAAPPAVAKCLLQKVADLPVTMVGPRPVVSAKINGVDVRLFIDTGSFANTLNPDAAARIGLSAGPLPPNLKVRGLTGEADMHMATANDFDILGAHIHQAQFLVGEHGLGSADGLIGQQILGKFDVEYDLANGVVRLFLPTGCGASDNLGYWNPGQVDFIPIEPIEPPSNAIVGPASVNGMKIHVLFDSGTPRSGMTVSAARRAGVRTDGPGVVSAGDTGGVGSRIINTWIAPFDSFAIGEEAVKNTRLRIASFEIEDADMLLGVDFFLSHHIYVARSQNRLYFSYNGGRVFNLEQGAAPPTPQGQAGIAAAPAQDAAAPKSAEDFVRRAAAHVSRHEYDAAIADYGQAVTLEPNDEKHLYDRGVARVLNRQPVIAMEDFDAALKLKPDDVPALILRGELRLASKDETDAAADFDAALKADPRVAVSIGETYARAGLYEIAIGDFDRWIAAHPRNEDIAEALAVRCRARAMWGQQLDKALGDCNQSLGFRPGDSEVYASRGLVRLRQGQFDPAIADFDTAIRMQPQEAWALYGRGIAELRKGEKDKGDADLAAAAAITPGLAARAAKIGLAP
jgi:tetratricopeptide (TPR) repeat protein